MQKVLDFLAENWTWISPIIYELAVRLIPTKKNFSLFEFVFGVFNKTIPNIRKKTSIIIFVLLSYSSFAQLNGNFKTIYLNNVTDTTITGVGTKNGTFYYNPISGKFRFRQGGTWASLGGGSGGGITNTAGVNEVPISDGTNLVPSGVFSGSGNLTMGAALTSTSSIFTLSSANELHFQTPTVLAGTLGGNILIESALGSTNRGIIELRAKTLYLGPPENTTGIISAPVASVTYQNGNSLNIVATNGYNPSGNGNGGSVLIQSGLKRSAGSGIDGKVDITSGNATLTISGASNGTLFTDTRATASGLEYAADYSANYTARSFVDKGYVTSAISTAAPNASSSTRGIAKLYTTTGTNTDGSMDQNSINTALNLSIADIATPSTAGSTITLDFSNKYLRKFKGSASFATGKTLATSNDTNAGVFEFLFTNTSLSGTITLPAGWVMSDINFISPTWTPPTTGTFLLGCTFYGGTTWVCNIGGPYN